MRCDHMVHFSTDLSLRLDSPMFWAPCHQSMSTLLPTFFPVPIQTNVQVYLCKTWL